MNLLGIRRARSQHSTHQLAATSGSSPSRYVLIIFNDTYPESIRIPSVNSVKLAV